MQKSPCHLSKRPTRRNLLDANPASTPRNLHINAQREFRVTLVVFLYVGRFFFGSRFGVAFVWEKPLKMDAEGRGGRNFEIKLVHPKWMGVDFLSKKTRRFFGVLFVGISESSETPKNISRPKLVNLGGIILMGMIWVVSPPSNSHHQDYYIFSR